MTEKIRNKSKAYHKHGKHKSVLMEARRLEEDAKAKRAKHKGKMFQSVIEAVRKGFVSFFSRIGPTMGP